MISSLKFHGRIRTKSGWPLEDRAGRQDRQADARNPFPLLVGVAVDDEVDRFRAQSGIVQQDSALGRGAVAGDRGPLGLQLADQRAAGGSRSVRTRPAEIAIVGEVGDALGSLLRHQLPNDASGRSVGSANSRNEPPWIGRSLDAVEEQPVPAQEPVARPSPRSSRDAHDRSCRTRRGRSARGRRAPR